jgi:hypothetical protein
MVLSQPKHHINYTDQETLKTTFQRVSKSFKEFQFENLSKSFKEFQRVSKEFQGFRFSSGLLFFRHML